MRPKEIVTEWVERFNRADVPGLVELYDENAVNHQVVQDPVRGKENIGKMFEEAFSLANMVCITVNIFEDGEWAILEWKDPLGLRGCGFLHIVADRIVLQRGYWDELTFRRLNGLPVPGE